MIELLADPAAARAMGEKGLAWVDREWRWEAAAAGSPPAVRLSLLSG